MNLQKGLEKTGPSFRKKDKEGKSKNSSKTWKKFRNRWLRRINKEEVPNTKLRKGYEF